jgi:hypothetical protein
MIPKLQIMETYTTNLCWCIYETVQNALLIQDCGYVSRQFLIKLLQESIHVEERVERRMARDSTSMRQSTEWGMRAFQSSMPCLKDHMKFEIRGEWRVTLTMMILLYNLQTRAVGTN